jgi:tyrosine-specific transport protein
MRFKKSLLALAILIGTIVGAGIFAIPYAISKSGIIPGLFYFLILGLVVTFLHLFFGEIVLRTKEKYRLIGYAQKYLGKWGKISISISTFLGITGVLLAYIILAGEFLKIIFSPLFSLSPFGFSLIFWLLLIYFVFRGIKTIAPVEVFTNLFFFIMIFLIFFLLLPKINLENFHLINLQNLFLPYGVIMFSLMGFTAIPEMTDVLVEPKEKRDLKKVIVFASIITIILYLFFSLSIIGVSGKNTSQDALSGLSQFLDKKIVILFALIGFITLADSFLIIDLYFRNTLIYDYHFPKIYASFLAVFFPLFFFLIGFREFISVISFIGTILSMIEGIVILLIFNKVKRLGDREPEYSLKIPKILLYILGAIFILGAISQIFYHFEKVWLLKLMEVISKVEAKF